MDTVTVSLTIGSLTVVVSERFDDCCLVTNRHSSAIRLSQGLRMIKAYFSTSQRLMNKNINPTVLWDLIFYHIFQDLLFK